MKILIPIISFLLTSLLTSSCAKTLSENIETEGLYTIFEVVADDNHNTYCKAIFRVGDGGIGGAYVEPSSDDKVFCNGRRMYKTEFAGIIEYRASASFNENSEYVFEFTRPEEFHAASVYLPRSIEIISPMLNEQLELEQNEAIEIQWFNDTNSSIDINLEVYDAYANSNGTHSSYRSVRQSQSPEVGVAYMSNSFNFEEINTTYGRINMTRTKVGHHPFSMSGTTSATIKTNRDISFIKSKN